ncbi:hypothetical protein Csa_014315 [Cucumis sativus]|nr:hypothetical protein Csa_014315 [Cucumis sativus]
MVRIDILVGQRKYQAKEANLIEECTNSAVWWSDNGMSWMSKPLWRACLVLHFPFQFMSDGHNKNPPRPLAKGIPLYFDSSFARVNPPIDNMSMVVMNSDQKMKKMMKKVPQRKRLSKKDRHSKITTAKGVRDRRMRLSLPVAKQFFGLQDMLGVDKGSKTVEWLLIQAKPEILKLATEKKNHNCFTINRDS